MFLLHSADAAGLLRLGSFWGGRVSFPMSEGEVGRSIRV
jgi:hypothetical protein